MNIIQVANVRWYNATAWYALRLGKLLQDAGHNVLILTIKDSDPLVEAAKMGLKTRTFDFNSKNPWALINLYRQLNGLVNEFKPDIVNCHRGEAFFIWALLRARLRSFGLVRTRGDQRPPKSGLINSRLHCRAADAVVGTNSATIRSFHEDLRVPLERLCLIPGGVDRAYFSFDAPGRARVRAEFGFADRHTVIGLLGRFDHVKGQLETIQAISLLREMGFSDLRLLLLGFESGIKTRQVREWLRRSRIEDISVITGRRPDLPACISAMDIGLVASLGSEAIARAALEIMSCGRPLVSTAVGVMPDLLERRALVEPGRPTALAALLERAATDEVWRAGLLAEQQKNMTQLSDEAFLKHSLTLYENVLGALPRR